LNRLTSLRKRPNVKDNPARSGPGDFPKRVTVELTNNCNLNCGMCPRKYMKAEKGYMPFDLYEKIIAEMALHNGIALIPFFRGESLLHPRFIDMISLAKRRGVGPIQLATNALLLTYEISKALIDMELDFISFSIDTVNADIYARVRFGGDLFQAQQNIDFFCYYKKVCGADKPIIQVSTVRTKETAKHIHDFVKYWHDKADRIRVYEEHSNDGSFGALNKTDCKDFPKRLPCFKPFTDLVIYWDGRVALCNHDWDRTRSLGDVNKTSIEKIWKSRKYKDIRIAHVENHHDLEDLCKKCDHWKSHYLPERMIGELYAGKSESV
jgi:radical SAM protein with 4Fe4S-binding SPASM domain